MPDAPALSVVVPIHDEVESIPTLYAELDTALKDHPGGVELILVDDGSTDGSLALLDALAKQDPAVHVIALDRNHGQSTALAAGFERARGDVIVTLDADLQNDPRDIPLLLAELGRADVVNGVRVGRTEGFVRRSSSRIANAFRNWLTEESVTDVGCSLRAMRSGYVRKLKPFHGMHRFLPTLLRLEGARVVEIPVSHRPRRFGRSKYGIANRLGVGIVDVLAVRWMQRRAVRWREREAAPGSGSGANAPRPATRRPA
ncbi:dolichol-phosphate mannosyltransferase [Myxococcaceae bacterium]|nr:dolichol-phosphate mannosyltransferase [Myxococcaceae bacterium]